MVEINNFQGDVIDALAWGDSLWPYPGTILSMPAGPCFQLLAMSVFLFIKIKLHVFWVLWSCEYCLLILEINNCRGDVTDVNICYSTFTAEYLPWHIDTAFSCVFNRATDPPPAYAMTGRHAFNGLCKDVLLIAVFFIEPMYRIGHPKKTSFFIV